MPEGPEVRWMVDQINKKIINKKKPCRLLEVEIVSGRYTKHGFPENYQKFNKLLKEDKIYLEDLKTKGKFIYMKTENSDWSIWMTLGMSGHLLLYPKEHLRFIFKTSNGDYYLDDLRNFGTLNFCPNVECLDGKLASIGPDFLNDSDKDFTPEIFVDIIRKMKQDKQIALALVDQKKMSSIGNYLRAEILYQAKISPLRTLKDLSDEELKNLFKIARKVVKKSYETQSKNDIHTYSFQVYMKKKDPKGNPVRGDRLSDKRTIWWVPEVQK